MRNIMLSEEDRLMIKEAIYRSAYKTQASFSAEVLMINRNSLARKLSGSRGFTALEIKLMEQELDITFDINN